MTKFVLEILDGDQMGDTVSLGEERITIGRKASNTLVIMDEKCSGQHAEIVFEDGGYVLRDHDSRNGTLLDGRKVTEVALSPFDTFQIGRVRVVFKEEGQNVPDDDGLQLERLDAAMIAKAQKGKRSLATMLVLVLVVAAAGAGAWFKFVYVPATTGGGESAHVVRVDGNLLGTGADSFESEEFEDVWTLRAAGSGYEPAYDHVNSGETAIEAMFTAPEEGGSTIRFALARSKAFKVSPGSKMRLLAFAATTGGGRAAIRARISSKAQTDSELTTGTTPIESEDFIATEFVLQVPRGMDQIEIELLALLPDEGASVRFDDVQMVVDRDDDATAYELKAMDGHVLTGVGGDVGITMGEEWTILGVLPLVSEPALVALRAARLLTVSDAGLELEATAIDDTGFELKYTAVEGARADGIELAFPLESSAVIGRSGDGGFLPLGPDLAGGAVREMLLGSDRMRCLITLPQEVSVRGRSGKIAYLIGLPNTFSCQLRVTFVDEAAKAREHNRTAVSLRREGNDSAALDELAITLQQFPHNDTEANAAQSVRNELMAALSQKIAVLRESGNEASFFNSKVGYDRISKEIGELVERFGRSHIEQVEELDQLDRDMKAGSLAIAQRDGEEHKANLKHLAEVFTANGQANLTKTVRDYIKKHYGGK